MQTNHSGRPSGAGAGRRRASSGCGQPACDAGDPGERVLVEETSLKTPLLSVNEEPPPPAGLSSVSKHRDTAAW